MKHYQKTLSLLCSLSLILGVLMFMGSDAAYADRKGGHYVSDRHSSANRHYNKKSRVIHRGHSYKKHERRGHHRDVIHRGHSYKKHGRRGHHHRDVIVIKPRGHRRHSHSYYYEDDDDDFYKWHAMTLITLQVLDNLNDN